MIRVEDIFSYSAKNPLLFNQYLFLFLFTAMFAGFTILHKQVRARNFYLLLFSLFFYYKCSGWYFLLLLFSTILDYGCGFGIYIVKEKWQKKLFLVLSISSNLGLLFFFKYSYFMVDSINGLIGTDFKEYNFLAAFANGMVGANFDIHQILLPVGDRKSTRLNSSHT